MRVAIRAGLFQNGFRWQKPEGLHGGDMECVREYIDCGMTSVIEDGPACDVAPTVPALLGQIAQMQEEAAYLRTMVCELLRKNERLREQAAASARLEIQPIRGVSAVMWA